jgi:salicylate hydroxylase
VIRAALTEPAPPVHSGLCAFRALVPAAAAPEFACRPAQAVWLGPGRHVVHYPVSGGELVNLVANTPGRWALLIRQPLPRWTWGPVTLLGDAAHPMLPFLGQGAAQAFEDAAMLANCLASGQQNPARALRRYESERIDRASRVQQGSHARADYNHLPDGPEQLARDDALRAAGPLAANAWIYAHDPFSQN